jgi:hypothetical protein
MFLNVNLASGVIPEGTKLDGMAMGAFQAKYMAESLWIGFWFLTLLNGFWILYSTHLGNTDILIRTMADILWMGSPRVRAWLSHNIAKLYYGLLGAFTVWAVFAVRMGQPFTQFKILANMAGFTMVVASAQILLVNRKFLPREIRAPWREWVLVACAGFYLFFSIRVAAELKPEDLRMVAIVIPILLSFWVWPTVRNGGGNPLGWVIGIIFLWPVFATMVGIRYRSRGLVVVGALGGVSVGWVLYRMAVS